MATNMFVPRMPQLPDPLEEYGRLVSLRQAVQQQQLMQQQMQANALGIQQKQMDIQRTQALNNAFANSLSTDENGNPTFDRQRVINSVAQAGQGSAIPDLNEKFLELDKLAGDVQKTRDEHNSAAIAYMGRLGREIQAANYDPTITGMALAHATGAGYGQEANLIRQHLNQKPDDLKQVVDEMIAASPEQATVQKDISEGDLAAAKTPGAKAESTIQQQQASMTPFQRATEGNLYLQASQGTPGAKQALNLETQQKVGVARAEGQARLDLQRQAMGGQGALANVPPHLIPAATAAATKAGEEFANNKAISDRMAAMMTEARKGNVVSYQVIPEEGALQIVTTQGVHRINQVEVNQYAGGGSLWQRMMGHVGKQLSGKSIPDSVLNDMAQIQNIVAKGSKSKYENSLRVINQNYGSRFELVEMGGLDSGGGQAQPTATPKLSGKAAKWGIAPVE